MYTDPSPRCPPPSLCLFVPTSIVLSAAQRRKNVSRIKMKDFLSDLALAFDLSHDLGFAYVLTGPHAHVLGTGARASVSSISSK